MGDRRDVVFLQGARTPMAEYSTGRRGDGLPGGAFKDLSAVDLGAIAVREALARSGVPAARIEHVVMGNALQTSGDAIYGARHVGLKAGVPVPVPALTVNRLCGSGIQSVISAAQMILLGEATVAIAGGMENMSQAPFVIRGAREGFKLGQGKLEDLLFVALLDTGCNLMMAETAERLAARYGISREEQDAYALRSQRAAAAALDRGVFRDEIVPVEVKGPKGATTVVDRDDHMKPDTTLEGLAKLPPAFGKDGTVTAGNASGIVDGAAACVIAEASTARKEGWTPTARVVDWAVCGVEPDVMGIGPAPAIRRVLEKARLRQDEIDLFEINEAFAGQYLAVERELQLDRKRVNVNGGAIALGHPLGASGTRLLLTMILELRRRRVRYGIASACIGGGQGIAMIVEAL